MIFPKRKEKKPNDVDFFKELKKIVRQFNVLCSVFAVFFFTHLFPISLFIYIRLTKAFLLDEFNIVSKWIKSIEPSLNKST